MLPATRRRLATVSVSPWTIARCSANHVRPSLSVPSNAAFSQRAHDVKVRRAFAHATRCSGPVSRIGPAFVNARASFVSRRCGRARPAGRRKHQRRPGASALLWQSVATGRLPGWQTPRRRSRETVATLGAPGSRRRTSGTARAGRDADTVTAATAAQAQERLSPSLLHFTRCVAQPRPTLSRHLPLVMPSTCGILACGLEADCTPFLSANTEPTCEYHPSRDAGRWSVGSSTPRRRSTRWR